MAAVFRIHYRLYPMQISQDRHFSLADVQSLSAQDALNYAIDQKLEGLLRQDLKTWQAEVKKQFKVDLTAFDGDWSSILEIYEWRNIFVHNGGRVNQYYLRKVPLEAQRGAQNGFYLLTDLPYLQRAMALFLRLGIYFSHSVWRHQMPEDAAGRLGVMQHVAKCVLEEGRFEDARDAYALFTRPLKLNLSAALWRTSTPSWPGKGSVAWTPSVKTCRSLSMTTPRTFPGTLE